MTTPAEHLARAEQSFASWDAARSPNGSDRPPNLDLFVCVQTALLSIAATLAQIEARLGELTALIDNDRLKVRIGA